MFKILFDDNGRINRRTFFERCLLIYLVPIIVGFASKELGGILYLIGIWAVFMQAFRRMHDINKPGYYALIPFYNIYLCHIN